MAPKPVTLDPMAQVTQESPFSIPADFLSTDRELTDEEQIARQMQFLRASQQGKTVSDCFVCVRSRRTGKLLKYDGVEYHQGEIMPTFGNHRNDSKLLKHGFVRRVKPDNLGLGERIAYNERRAAEEEEDMME